MDTILTPQQIAEMKAFLKEHPVDHRWDDPPGVTIWDGDIPDEQVFARITTDVLKRLGELPEEG